jgi:excisionase family DNA binding protein
MKPDAYTRHQVCERLQISLPTLERLIRRGELPVVKIGRRVLIRRQTLEAFLRSREVRVTEAAQRRLERPEEEA